LEGAEFALTNLPNLPIGFMGVDWIHQTQDFGMFFSFLVAALVRLDVHDI
jgi:hypothetical protein